jgi:hypothetical protein
VKGDIEGVGLEPGGGGGGGGGLRGVVCCHGDNRIAIAGNCIPSQGVFFSFKKMHTEEFIIRYCVENYC